MRPPGLKPITILMADDDPDDRMMTHQAMEECRMGNDVRFVEDGEELMDYLHQRGKYAAPADSPRPGLVLLDLHMPRKDGREVLREMRASATLRAIPVVVLTTSRSDTDIYRSYYEGANSFISKPVTFQGLVEALRVLDRFYFEIVSIPRAEDEEEEEEEDYDRPM